MEEQTQQAKIKETKSKILVSLVLIAIVILSLLFYFFIYENNSSTITASVLISRSVSGGLCLDDVSDDGYGCNTTLTIDTEGNYEFSSIRTNNNKKILNSGKMSQDQLSDINNLIEDTDFSSIKSKIFTGDCPTAWDGSEVVYKINIPDDQTETIGSCTYDLSSEIPLFEELSNFYSDNIKYEK